MGTDPSEASAGKNGKYDAIFGSRRLSAILHPASLSFALIGLIITTFAASALYHSEKEALGTQFNNNINNLHQDLRDQMVGNEQLLRSGLAMFRTSGGLSESEWRTFVGELDMPARFPGTEGLGFATVVRAAERKTFEERIGQEEEGPIRIRPEVESPLYFPVLRFEFANGRNERSRAIGYDLMANTGRSVAMARARDSGLMAVSSVFDLEPELGEGGKSTFLICLPVYGAGAELSTVRERRAAIEGFVFSLVDVKRFLTGVVGNVPSDIGLRILDGGEGAAVAPLYASSSVNLSPAFKTALDLHAGGNYWTIEAFSLAGFENWLPRLSSLAIALSGVAITLFGMIILADSKAVQENATFAAEAMADSLREREAEVRELNTGLEKEVAIRTAHLEEANEELRSFSYTVSHDLRAPVRHVEAMAGFLVDECGGQLNGSARDYIDRILQSAAGMHRIIGDILQLATCSDAHFHPEPTDLTALAEEIAAEFRCQNPGREIEVWIDQGLHAVVDSTVIRTTMQNLLENAFKFTSKRERAEIHVGAMGEGPDRTFYVSDNGAGFDMGQAEAAFLLFKRLHRQSDFVGTGVGLATVRKIIRRHGGDIWVDSTVDVGTTFFFTLNHVKSLSERESSQSIAHHQPSLRPDPGKGQEKDEENAHAESVKIA